MEPDAGLSFELLAASLRADAADLGVFLEAFAAKLGAALPHLTQVETEGGLFAKRRVRRVRLRLGEHDYEVSRANAGVEATRTHSVRGVRLKTELLPLEEWIDELARALADHARASASAREALGRLLR